MSALDGLGTRIFAPHFSGKEIAFYCFPRQEMHNLLPLKRGMDVHRESLPRISQAGLKTDRSAVSSG